MCAQVAFYVESYSLQRLKVSSRLSITNRMSLNALCAKRKSKAPPGRSSSNMEHWYVWASPSVVIASCVRK